MYDLESPTWLSCKFKLLPVQSETQVPFLYPDQVKQELDQLWLEYSNSYGQKKRDIEAKIKALQEERKFKRPPEKNRILEAYKASVYSVLYKDRRPTLMQEIERLQGLPRYMQDLKILLLPCLNKQNRIGENLVDLILHINSLDLPEQVEQFSIGVPVNLYKSVHEHLWPAYCICTRCRM